MSQEIATIILAAGASTRMKGRVKQLLPWGQTTLLGNAIEQALPVSNEVYVVLGANADKITQAMDLKVPTVHNPNWERGMGSSIAVGIRKLMHSQTEFLGVLLMLVDQPLVDAKYLDGLKTRFLQGDKKIVATSYSNRPGVPAIFHYSLFDALSCMNQEFGARELMTKHKDQCASMEPEGRQVDVDTTFYYKQLFDLHNFKDENI